VLTLYDGPSNELRISAVIPDASPDEKTALEHVAHIPLEGSAPGVAFTSKQPLLVTTLDPAQFPSQFTHMVHGLGVRSACFVPLLTVDRTLGVLIACAQEEGRFAQRDLDLLVQIGGQVSIAIENAQAFQEISELKDRIASEKIYLEEEIRGEHNFGEIVGESPALARVLQQVETVAPTESTVLLLGETGTGKELVARAVHDRSTRRGRTLVKVNCAAIPLGLLESELFGHEKGAFTGAIERKIGRFELAHQGTLFLDEVGDIPLELQAKLLRVLQDQEFERLGSTRSIKVDVRIVAATNRLLHEMVAERTFRSDLYYRLNVFPIVLPPLRDRREDIARLVRYFAQKFARRMKKSIDTIPADAMAILCRWPWPGNVRELENVIERAVIQSRGSVLQVPLHEFRNAPQAGSDRAVTLEDAERDHILKVLRETEWTIGGPSGAAARLGMKRTTLNSRMHKLGISRPSGSRPSH
jgi:formate hydrogenlyase transcriptional activator